MKKVSFALLALTLIVAPAVLLAGPVAANGPMCAEWYADSGGFPADIADLVAGVDMNYVEVGPEASVFMRFPDPYAAYPDGTSNWDLEVVTLDNPVEPWAAYVYVSSDGSTWTYVGEYSDEWSPLIDLDLYTSDPAKYVWVQGVPCDMICWYAFDLNAVVALNYARPVAIDIKPGSDPNALNPRSKGVLPVAILSTEDYDAMQVDPETVRLRYGLLNDGVAPLRWNCEDVNEDGLMDMVFKFKTQEVAAQDLTSLEPGSTAMLHLTGHMLDDMPIAGEDMVVIPPYPDG